MFTKMKNWLKDYYKEVSSMLKHDKGISRISWGTVFVSAAITLAFMLADPAGAPFMVGAFITGLEGIDMFTNTMQGNSSSYLVRGAMYAGMTALAPVVALAEYGVEKFKEHRSNTNTKDGEVLDKPFETDTPVKESSAVISDNNSSEFVSQRHTFDDSAMSASNQPITHITSDSISNSDDTM